MSIRSISFATAFFVATAGSVDSAVADENVKTLRVFPSEVSLSTNRDFQRVVVQAVAPDGVTHDASEKAEWKIANDVLVQRDGDILRAKADGETKITISYAGHSVELPVKTANSGADRDLRFETDILPIFTKSGCNTGSCHGAARGKDGFRLSLFGFDPAGDYYRVTREQLGRRINLAVPEKSLIVEKSIGAVPHTGGKLFDGDSSLSKDLVSWIAKGAPTDPADTPKCVGIEFYPAQVVLQGEGETQPMTVVATYSNGTTRDVTKLAFFSSNNKNAADIDENGLATSGSVAATRSGEAFVIARFDKYTVGSQIIVLPKDVQYERPQETPVNEIDTLVLDKLQKLRILPSPISDDEEFLRRIYIDLVGLLPSPAEYDEFIADTSADKRANKIDELINRKEFTEIWTMKWAEWLQMRSNNNQMSYKAVVLYHAWLRDQIARDVPVNEMVKDLLASTGGTFAVPPTNYYQTERDNLKVAENVAQTFMGMQIQCAQCHNHPFDRWTQDDYYGFAAFFAQVGRKGAEDYREQIIYNRGGGETRHPVTGKNAIPTFLGGGKPEDRGIDMRGKDRREIVAAWLASPENPFFAKNVTNRVWDHFFGLGIVDPVDDVRVSNPPSNPELLEELASRFTESGYNFKQLVKDICLSNTYQRTSARIPSNEADEANFAHQTVRRIKAESMLDIISQVTTTQDKFTGLPTGARATQIVDGNTSTYFLTTFGRAKRETVCTCEVKMDPTLSQALHLLNGDATNNKIKQGKVVQDFLAEGLAPIDVIDRLYVTCFTRKPTAAEREAMEQVLAGVKADDKAAMQAELEDIFWALLNSRELLFNH